MQASAIGLTFSSHLEDEFLTVQDRLGNCPKKSIVDRQFREFRTPMCRCCIAQEEVELLRRADDCTRRAGHLRYLLHGLGCLMVALGPKMLCRCCEALPSMQSQVPASCRQQPPPPSDFVLESGVAASVPYAANCIVFRLSSVER